MSAHASTFRMPLHPEPGVTTRLSIMMFLQFFVWGAYYVSMTGWMKAQGIDALGWWAYTVGPIAAIVSPFFLGIIADRFFATQRVLCTMHVLGGLALLLIPPVVTAARQNASTPESASFLHPFVLLLLAHMLCYMPTLGLTNSIAFRHLPRPEKQFPVVRVFGTIGWIVGNVVVGGSITLSEGNTFVWIPAGTSSSAQFFIAGGAALALGLFSLSLPHTPPPSKGKSVAFGQLLGLGSLRLLAKPSYLIFIVCSFLICIPLAGYYSNAYNFVKTVVPNNAMITMSSGQMSEFVFMLLMPFCFARLGVKWMLAAGMLGWVVRYGLFAGAAADKVVWMTALGVLLHGICYDFFFVAGVIYVDKVAPKELRSQAQGFLVLVTQGLGLGAGAVAFGKLIEHATPPDGLPDWQKIWMYPAAFAGAVLLVFVALFRERKLDGA